MSANCLVTQLLGSVNNPSLKKLGEIKIDFDNYNGNLLIEYFDTKTVNDLRFTGVSFTVLSSTTATIVGTGTVFIPMEQLRTLYCHYTRDYSGDCTIDDSYGYATTMTAFQWWSGDLALSDIAKLTRMVAMDIRGNQSTEDIAVLLPLKDTLTSLNLAGTSTSGSIIDAAKLYRLADYDFSYTNVTGDLMDFAKVRRGLGQETGSVRIESSNSQLTFNGHETTGRYYLTWTASTITWNGEEVENSDVINEE